MDVQKKLDEIVAAVSGARSMPMSASCVVNRAELLAMLEEVRAALPDSLAQAQAVLGAVDHAGGRHGHRAGALYGRDDLVELLLHVHRVLATLYSWMETDGTTVRAVGSRPTPGDGASVAVAARHFCARRSVSRPRT